MNDLWFCLDCSSVVELDVHGRCPNCGLEAVDVALRPQMTAEGLYLEDQLEKLWRS